MIKKLAPYAAALIMLALLLIGLSFICRGERRENASFDGARFMLAPDKARRDRSPNGI